MMSKSLIAAVLLGAMMIACAVLFVQWRETAIRNLTLTPEASKVLPA